MISGDILTISDPEKFSFENMEDLVSLVSLKWWYIRHCQISSALTPSPHLFPLTLPGSLHNPFKTPSWTQPPPMNWSQSAFHISVATASSPVTTVREHSYFLLFLLSLCLPSRSFHFSLLPQTLIYIPFRSTSIPLLFHLPLAFRSVLTIPVHPRSLDSLQTCAHTSGLVGPTFPHFSYPFSSYSHFLRSLAQLLCIPLHLLSHAPAHSLWYLLDLWRVYYTVLPLFSHTSTVHTSHPSMEDPYLVLFESCLC